MERLLVDPLAIERFVHLSNRPMITAFSGRFSCKARDFRGGDVHRLQLNSAPFATILASRPAAILSKPDRN